MSTPGRRGMLSPATRTTPAADLAACCHATSRASIFRVLRPSRTGHRAEAYLQASPQVADAETGRAITRRCMELGLSMNIVSVGAMAAIWRIAPPLTVTRAEIDRGVEILDQAINEVLAGDVPASV